MSTQNFLHLRPYSYGELIFQQGETGQAYQVTQGMVALEQSEDSASAAVVQLAMPGDLIGIEGLFEQTYSLNARALFPAQLVPVMGDKRFIKGHVLPQVCIQQQRQSVDMMKLRSGKIPHRLAYLLQLFESMQEQRRPAITRRELPSLKYLAQILDARVETVCRELNHLLPEVALENKNMSYLARTHSMGGLLLAA